MDKIDNLIREFRNFESADILLQVIQFIIWTIFILFFAWLLQKLLGRIVNENLTRYRVKKSIRIGSYFLILLLAIVSFTGKLQYFTITIGLISAGIAFALQEVILSVAGWIAIYSSGIYKPGDRVEINGMKGDVIDIGITKTTLMEIGDWISSDNYNGRIVQVSNASVFRSAVKNYSTDFPFVWDEINLPVKYGSDVTYAVEMVNQIMSTHLKDYAEFAKEHWKGMVKKYMIENANVEPTVTISLNDNWIELNLRYVVDYKKRRNTKSLLFTDIFRAIESSGGSVSMASSTFEITAVPEMKVNIKP